MTENMGDKQYKQLGIIEGTELGVEDHGVLSFWLHVNFGGAGQGFGGYALDEPHGRGSGFKGRHGTAFGCEVILRVLGAVGVEKWEDLKGKEIWVYRDTDNFLAGKILGIEAPDYRSHEGAFFIEDTAKEYLTKEGTVK
jgi:hypothetical protein